MYGIMYVFQHNQASVKHNFDGILCNLRQHKKYFSAQDSYSIIVL
jgi:hypothetical protein